MMKLSLLVSNVWKDQVDEGSCSRCGKPINLSWGDYSFRLLEGKRKKDALPVCKTCAVTLQQEKSVRLVPDSFFQNQLQLKTALWRKPRG